MYSLVKTYAIKKELNSLWKTEDVSTLKLAEIFQTYSDVYIELSNPFIVGPVNVHLKSLEASYSNSQQTLDELFIAEPALALPTVALIPTHDTRPSMYMDAFRAGYKLELTAPGHTPNSHISESLKTEIAIRRDATSTKDMYDYCLFTVNGFLHPTDYDANYLYVMEGGKSLKKSRRNTCGINSFERVGKITQQRIDGLEVGKVDAATPLAHQVLLRTPPSMVGKSLMLSVGGYLVTPEENVFQRISDDLWILNTDMLDIVGRYFESRRYIDFTALNLTSFGKDKDKISLLELQSDEVIRKYLTLAQSFFIAVDAPNLIHTKKYVRHSPLANSFITYSNPTSPLFLGRGRQADYWKQQDEAQWAITVENGFRANLTKDTVDSSSQLVDSGSSTPFKIYENSRAFLMETVSQVRSN